MYFHRLLACALLMVIITGCSENPSRKKTPEPFPVQVVEVGESLSEKALSFSGNILPFKTIKFGFMVAGKISAVHVVEGQYVHKGDIIAQIDPTDYNFALAASRAQFEEASGEYERLSAMYEKGSLTLSDYEKITALYQEAKADYAFKTKQVNDTRLYAPDHGWIAVEGVEVGEIVPQGMPLFGLVQTNLVFAEAAIPENEINLVKPEDTVIVRVPAIKNKNFTGTISRISPVADPYARSFAVKATVTNPAFELKPGMIAFVYLSTGEKDKQILIPADAVGMDSNGHTYVFVFRNGKAHRAMIRTGNATADFVVIESGLKTGDTLITQGRSKLYEGAPVSIQ